MERLSFTQVFFMNNEWQDFLLPRFQYLDCMKRPQDYAFGWEHCLPRYIDIDVQEEVTYPNKFIPRGVRKLKCSDK